MDPFWFLVFNCFWERISSGIQSRCVVKAEIQALVQTVVRLSMMLQLIQICSSINYVQFL